MYGSSKDFWLHNGKPATIFWKVAFGSGVDFVETNEPIRVGVESIPQFGNFPMVNLAHDAHKVNIFLLVCIVGGHCCVVGFVSCAKRFVIDPWRIHREVVDWMMVQRQSCSL